MRPGRLTHQSRKVLGINSLVSYDQAHVGLRRLFNNLAASYDQAHGSYGQAHGARFARPLANYSIRDTYATRDFAPTAYMVNGFMVYMVMV